MKIAFGIIVFNGNYVLKETLESIYPYANQILIAEGPVQFWQDEGIPLPQTAPMKYWITFQTQRVKLK